MFGVKGIGMGFRPVLRKGSFTAARFVVEPFRGVFFRRVQMPKREFPKIGDPNIVP